MIPPMNLSSRPETEIRMREATVAEMLDFADVDPDHEEELTSIFLDKIQAPETYHDPRTWTGPDRRLALWWNWVHTVENEDTTIPLKYNCRCGERHTCLFDARKFADEYRPLKGKPEREFEHDGQKVVVRPLTGQHLETLENFRIRAEELGREHGTGSPEARKAKAEMVLHELLLSFEIHDAPDGLEAWREQEKWVKSMAATRFAVFAREVRDRLNDMAHGLPMESENGRLFLLVPEHQCPRKEDVRTPLRLQFRNFDYIPTVLGRGVANDFE